MIKRKEYLDKLIGYKDKKIIKIITGIRRCGKSTLMEIFQNYLKEEKINETQIITLNFEDYDNQYLCNPDSLHEYIKNKLIPDQQSYIFLDEIQMVKDFQKVVDSIYIKKNTDIYLTGSNALILSGEL